MQKVPFALLGSLAKIWPDLAPANKLPNITIVDPTTYASMSDTRRQSRIYVVLRPDDPKLLPFMETYIDSQEVRDYVKAKWSQHVNADTNNIRPFRSRL